MVIFWGIAAYLNHLMFTLHEFWFPILDYGWDFIIAYVKLQINVVVFT